MAKIKATEQLQMGIYNFHPRWTTNYSVSIQDRIMEMEDVIKTGYFNSITVEVPYLNLDEFWRVIIENDCSVWLNIYDLNNSSKRNVKTQTTFKEWVKIYDDELDILKSHPERWERFHGIHYDEPIWRGMSNGEFLECTKHFHDKYALKNFPVFAMGEFLDYEGNAHLINMDAKGMQKVISAALKYVTDVGFDSYGIDLRDGVEFAQQHIDRWRKRIDPRINNGSDYYIYATERMLKLFDHDVNVWYFPTAYTCHTHPGLNGITRADEGFCKGHLEFFEKLLMKQKHPGGLFLYTYISWPPANGLQDHLVVKYEDGTQKLKPENEEPKWKDYSECLIEMTERFRNTKVDPITAKDIK